jgi:hypothetical protein
MATKFDSYKFMQEVFVYLGQEMKESADITYILSTRNKFIAEAEALGAGDMIMPNIFPLTGKYASTIEVLQANPSGTILAALEQYFADYIESRQLPDFDLSTLTAEAKRLAKLFLASITEIAIAILMIGMAHVQLLKHTPIDRRLAFIKAMRRNYIVPFHPFDHTYSAFSLCVSYNTSR